MDRRLSWLGLGVLLCVIGCGNGDDDGGAAPTATAVVATATATPTATATSPAATATATARPPTATATVTATATTTFTASPTATNTPIPDSAEALFSIDAADTDNPFPSDRLLDQNGFVEMTGAQLSVILPADAKYDKARTYFDMVAGQLGALRGFSTFAPIRVRFDRAVTVAANENPAGILVLRFDDPSVAAPIRVAAVTPDIAADYALEIQPLVPLEPKTRYVYVVTTAVRDTAGQPVHASSELAAELRGDVELSAWRAALDPILAALQEERGIGIDDIAAIDYFTTEATTDDLLAIRDLFLDGTLPAADPVFEDSPIPGLVTGVFPEGTPEFTALIGATSGTVAAVAVGSFPSYDFRSGPQSGFDPERVSGAVTPSINNLDFYMTIPKAPAPAGGYPITIFGHGLGQSGRDALTAATLFAGEVPSIVIGISAVEHGLRGNVLDFFNLENGFATREHFRQTIADMMQLVRMIEHTDVPPFDLVDKSDIRYFGISLGGIMGALLMPFEPDIPIAMLSVPGGGLPAIIRSNAISGIILPLLSTASGVPGSDPFFPVLLHRFIQTSQWIIDAGDPINAAAYLIDPDRRLPGVAAKTVLVHEGIFDNVVPNMTTDDLARAIGLLDLKASRGCSNPNGCSGIWRYVMGDYGGGEGHLVTFFVPEARAQAIHFFDTAGHEVLDASPLP